MINESRVKRRQAESSTMWCTYNDRDYSSYWYLIFKESITGNPNDEVCLGSFNMGGVNKIGDILEHNGHTYEVTRTEYKRGESYIFGNDILTDKTNVIWVK